MLELLLVGELHDDGRPAAVGLDEADQDEAGVGADAAEDPGPPGLELGEHDGEPVQPAPRVGVDLAAVLAPPPGRSRSARAAAEVPGALVDVLEAARAALAEEHGGVD